MSSYSMLPAMVLMNARVIGDEPQDAPVWFPERRRWERIRAAPMRARIAWRIPGFRVLKTPVTLIDISQGGARIAIVSAAPRDLSHFWMGLRALPCEWVKATIEEVSRRDDGWVCRLRFVEDPCPGLMELASRRRG